MAETHKVADLQAFTSKTQEPCCEGQAHMAETHMSTWGHWPPLEPRQSVIPHNVQTLLSFCHQVLLYACSISQAHQGVACFCLFSDRCAPFLFLFGGGLPLEGGF